MDVKQRRVLLNGTRGAIGGHGGIIPEICVNWPRCIRSKELGQDVYIIAAVK